MERGNGNAGETNQQSRNKVVRDVAVGSAFLLLTLILHIQKVQRENAMPPQPVAIQLDTQSLLTGDALDPDKRCTPAEFKYGQWWPMECPETDVIFQ